jgi:hypothetical protein
MCMSNEEIAAKKGSSLTIAKHAIVMLMGIAPSFLIISTM